MDVKKILIIDDNEMNIELLADILGDEYETLEAADGECGLKIIEEHFSEISAILLDLNMPRMNGYEFLEYMNEKKFIDKIPVLIVSAEDSAKSEKRCFDLGASDFIRRPFDANIVKKRVDNISEQYSYRNHLESKVLEQTREIIQQAREIKEQNARLVEQSDILKKHNSNIIQILGTVVESRDLESGEHVMRVKKYTEIMARQMMKDYPEYELDEHKIEVIAAASPLHDIGKVAIPDSVLLKPGRLSADEIELVKSHTIRGCEIIEKIEDAWDEEYGRYSYEICRYHHERYDGRGYADGLSGDEIPISAQCVSIADVYDALVNERCYKAAIPPEKAYQMIITGECGIFSPKLLEAFRKSKAAFEKVYASKL